MYIDFDLMTSTFSNSLIAQSFSGTNNVQTSWPSYASSHQPIFLGLRNFSFSTNQNPQLYMPNDSSFNVSSTSGYVSFLYNYIAISSQCAAPNIYYRDVDQLCYATCPSYTFGTVINSTSLCVSCYYSCYSCVNTSSSGCSGCDPLMHRSLSASTCGCMSSYVDIGVPACVACHYSCYTCLNTSSNGCVTCDPASRVLFGNTCPCILDYVDIGVPVCLNPLLCDDNNTQSGDGCSSENVIETNYTCTNFTSTTPSECSYNQPLTLTI
jgi:hypothetical protein